MIHKNHLSIGELVQSGILPGEPTEASIRAMIARKQIPFRKMSGTIFFLKDEVVEWLRSAGGNPLPGKRHRPNPEIISLAETISAFDASGLTDLKRAIEQLTDAIEFQNI
jgi:hypothetical protein